MAYRFNREAVIEVIKWQIITMFSVMQDFNWMIRLEEDITVLHITWRRIDFHVEAVAPVTVLTHSTKSVPVKARGRTEICMTWFGSSDTSALLAMPWLGKW